MRPVASAAARSWLAVRTASPRSTQLRKPWISPSWRRTSTATPAYGRKLAEAGVAVEVRRHDALIHGFLNWVERGDAVRAANLELAEVLATGVKAR